MPPADDPFARMDAEHEKLAAQQPAKRARSSADQGGPKRPRKRPGPPRGWWDLIKRWLGHGALGRCTGNGTNVYLAVLRLAKAYRKAQEGADGTRRLGEYRGGRKRLGMLCGGVSGATVSRGLDQLCLRGILERRQIKNGSGGGVVSSMVVYILDVPAEREEGKGERLEGME